MKALASPSRSGRQIESQNIWIVRRSRLSKQMKVLVRRKARKYGDGKAQAPEKNF